MECNVFFSKSSKNYFFLAFEYFFSKSTFQCFQSFHCNFKSQRFDQTRPWPTMTKDFRPCCDILSSSSLFPLIGSKFEQHLKYIAKHNFLCSPLGIILILNYILDSALKTSCFLQRSQIVTDASESRT